MSISCSRRACLLLSAVSAAAISFPVLAQEDMSSDAAPRTALQAPSENILREIVVTGARRRNEAAQDTPLSIAAISAAQLERNQVSSIVQIAQLTPNLHIHKQQGASGSAGIYLRGFGVQTNNPSQNPAVAVFVDGVYQAQVNGNQLDLFDLQSIEVMKGPQGTLLGKNAPSGAISVTTKRPSGAFGAQGQVNYERFDRVELRGLIEAPIVQDVLAAKVSALYKSGGNYAKIYTPNALIPGPVPGQVMIDPDGETNGKLGGERNFSVRAGLLFTPSSDFEMYTTFNYAHDNSREVPIRYIGTSDGAEMTPRGYPVTVAPNAACAVFGMCTPIPKRSTAMNYVPRHKVNAYDISNTLDWRTGPVTITSVTGYKKWKGDNNSDSDGTPFTILHVVNSKLNFRQFSQEFRFSSEEGGGLDLDGKLDWVAGLYYFSSKFTDRLPLSIFDPSNSVPGTQIISEQQEGRDKSYAAFVHVEYKLTPQWSLNAGGRQTWDKKDHLGIQWPTGTPMPPYIEVNRKWNNFSFEAGTSYKFDETKMAYLRFAEGYRGGGHQAFPTSPASAIPYDPETVKSWELGFKTEWLDRRLRVNVDFFRNKYSDLQRSIFIGNVLVTQNAAAATVKGIEGEIVAVPVDSFNLRANFGYLNAKYKSFQTDVIGAGIVTDNSNFRFPYAPKWSFGIGGDLDVFNNASGKLTASADYNWASKQSLNIVDIPGVQQKSYGVANGSLRYSDPTDRYNITIYGRNIFNKYYFSNIDLVNALTLLGTEGIPATWGISAGFKF